MYFGRLFPGLTLESVLIAAQAARLTEKLPGDRLKAVSFLEYKFRFWLIKNNKKVFGEGPLMLLKKVEELGSLRQAAIDMGMSYSKAWKIMKQIEDELQMQLLERTIGGKTGGGSTITIEAKKFIQQYEAFMASINEIIEEEMNRYFMI